MNAPSAKMNVVLLSGLFDVAKKVSFCCCSRLEPTHDFDDVRRCDVVLGARRCDVRRKEVSFCCTVEESLDTGKSLMNASRSVTRRREEGKEREEDDNEMLRSVTLLIEAENGG